MWPREPSGGSVRHPRRGRDLPSPRGYHGASEGCNNCGGRAAGAQLDWKRGGPVIRLATASALAGLLACSSSPVPCATAHDCSPGERCTNKVCQGPDSSPGALGDSCNGDAQCGSGLLCNPLSISFPNGFCTVDCSSSSCASGICTTLSTGTDICSPGCGANTDCRQGYVCCPALGSVCAPAGACTPAACERPVTTSSLPVAQVIVHETHKVGETVNFTMPAGIGAVSIVQQALVAGLTITADNGQVYDNSAVPLTIRGNGQTVFDVNGPQV